MDNKTLTEVLSEKLHRPSSEIQKMMQGLGEVVAEVLIEGDSITIPSVGCFEPRKRLQRRSVHPSPGKPLLIPPKLSVVFKPSSLLKQKIRDL